ncbi:cytochrome c oxidase subunit II [Hyphomicrobium sp.]|uniref:cytochrome c oxidase subunit II n=1 Tax=Hyphomicrobium sp. TaxID=82 RepID=UPI002BEE58AA|nr:cytochrome c oxidase subunit II [Hyphomicrobium sp.]HRN87164.1 cytochrome c oxidase subunit II [Hyphomicrobium sp.]HRQ25764.1 cytochrome c oxidase subunit II [Hyphomicrobium sp.]
MFPLIVVAVGLASCSGELSTLSPAGPVAGSVAMLWWVMASGAALLFALVMGLFLFTMFRPGFGRSLSPRAWIVGGGLVLPLPVLVPLLAYSFEQGERLLLLGGPKGDTVRIEARASMWQWEFFYLDEPDQPSTIASLDIPAGAVVEVTTTSEDVIHSFWVPRLGGKIDAIPGHRARVRLLADAPGTYSGLCAEYCGVGHMRMSFSVRAHEPDEYKRAIETARAASVHAGNLASQP